MTDSPWVDDVSVSDDELLWRGVPAGQYNPDSLDPTRTIPSEGMFRTFFVSMYVRSESSVSAMLAKNASWRLWCLTAKQIREYECIIVREVDDWGDTAHVV